MKTQSEMIGMVPPDLCWAQVELFRHQYGELPKDNDKRTIDYPKAFTMGAELISKGKVDPYNASTIVELASYITKKYFKLFEEYESIKEYIRTIEEPKNK